MKKMLLIISLLLVSCGKETQQISLNATDGEDGYSLVSASERSASLCGTVGGNTVMIALDLNRNGVLDSDDSLQTQFVVCDGERGEAGEDGVNGLSCDVAKSGKISTITCAGSSVQVKDGKKGEQGEQGLPGAQGIPGLNGSIVEIVELCNNNVNHREIALRISPNTLVAFFQKTTSITVNAPGGQQSVLNSLNGRLTVLTNGTYTTTDENGCTFKVNNGIVTPVTL